MVRKKKPQRGLLTETELEIMQSLWRQGTATAAQVRQDLPHGESLAYTTVSTMLRVLEQKGFVASSKLGRGHLYQPRLSREEYESRTVGDLVERVFEGAPVALLKRLLETEELTETELEEIRMLLR